MGSEMKKTKIMHILNTSSYSGAENVVITLINSLREDVDSVYVSLDGSIREILDRNEIAFYPIPKLTVKNIRKAIKDIKPDIIHAHDFTAGVMASVATFRTPIINHLHNNPPWIKHFSIRSIVYGLSAFRYKKILTVSRSVMDEFIFGIFFKRKTEVVGNPVDVQAICYKAECAELRDSFDIVYLGRISEQKNPLFFLDIISALKNRAPHLRVAMIGDGEMRAEVEQRIMQLSLQDNIVLYGFLENPYGILKNAKVMCMPSLWEGFGLAAVEALSLGIPVVASPVGGLADIIDDEHGNLCDTKKEFVECIKDIILNNDIQCEKSKKAFERSKEFDNIQTYRKMLMEVYGIISDRQNEV